MSLDNCQHNFNNGRNRHVMVEIANFEEVCLKVEILPITEVLPLNALL